MRGTVAKRLRRNIFGDHSIRTREYKTKSVIEKFASFIMVGIRNIPVMMSRGRGTDRLKGLRADYQLAKKQYKRSPNYH
ncbi:MAG: hypothetical protein PVG39_02140 [Desulfobacteraceae bacterium]|jgi:hypothetical protein